MNARSTSALIETEWIRQLLGAAYVNSMNGFGVYVSVWARQTSVGDMLTATSLWIGDTADKTRRSRFQVCRTTDSKKNETKNFSSRQYQANSPCRRVRSTRHTLDSCYWICDVVSFYSCKKDGVDHHRVFQCRHGNIPVFQSFVGSIKNCRHQQSFISIYEFMCWTLISSIPR